METIISEIKLFESELTDSSKNGTVIPGFSSFLEAPPNQCHKILAQYLKQGSNIVSLNYGNTVSKAFNMQYNTTFPVVPMFDNEMQMYLYSDENITQGKIYHPHGVAEDLDTIGISLSEVKKVLSPKFKKQITEWISSGYCFIFLGYSCSDTLDINPFFEHLNFLPNNNSMAVIINHSSVISLVTNLLHKLRGLLHEYNSICYRTNKSRRKKLRYFLTVTIRQNCFFGGRSK